VALIFFAVGVVTGTILSFEFGLLWPEFMATFGEVFGIGFALAGKLDQAYEPLDRASGRSTRPTSREGGDEAPAARRLRHRGRPQGRARPADPDPVRAPRTGDGAASPSAPRPDRAPQRQSSPPRPLLALTFGSLALALVLMLVFHSPISRVVGVAATFEFIISGVFLIADHAFLGPEPRPRADGTLNRV
jgi:hypothetical protein